MKRYAKIAISCVFFAMKRSFGILGSLARPTRPKRRPQLVVLAYHDLPDAKRENFARQMDMLLRWSKVVPANWIGEADDARLCAITFDDAFLSVLENALPELATRSLPCTIFVPAGVMGRAPDWAVEAPLRAPDIVAGEDSIASLPSSLVVIGAHSVSHPYLTRIPPEVARGEIELSRSILTNLTGQEVNLLAFPYGDYDDATVTMCKDAGYSLVYTIEPRVVDPALRSFIRGRISVDVDDGSLEFFLKMSGAYSWMLLASKLKRAVSGQSSITRL